MNIGEREERLRGGAIYSFCAVDIMKYALANRPVLDENRLDKVLRMVSNQRNFQ